MPMTPNDIQAMVENAEKEFMAFYHQKILEQHPERAVNEGDYLHVDGITEGNMSDNQKFIFHLDGNLHKNFKEHDGGLFFVNYGDLNKKEYKVKSDFSIGVGTVGVIVQPLRYGNISSSAGFAFVTTMAGSTKYTTISLGDGGLDVLHRIPRNMFVPIEFTDDVKNEVVAIIQKILPTTGMSEYEKMKSFFAANHPTINESVVIPRCKQCGREMIGTHPTEYEGDLYCSSCYDRYFTRCCKCNNIVKVADAIQTQEGGYLCKECGKYHYITNYHRGYPSTKFYGKGEKMPFMGIELEIDEGGRSDNIAAKIVDAINGPGEVFMWCSSDSSIHNGLEMITQPATLEYHTSIKSKYQRLFTMLKKMGFLSHDTQTCGLHVHINRDFFGSDRGAQQECTKKLLTITEKFWKEFVIFSRRNKYRIDRFAKKLDRSVDRYVSRYDKSCDHDGHYYAINISNENTIEFRIFKGTLNINTFIATLQLVNACVVAAKTKTMREIQNMTFDELCSDRTCKKYWATMKDRTDTEE